MHELFCLVKQQTCQQRTIVWLLGRNGRVECVKLFNFDRLIGSTVNGCDAGTGLCCGEGKETVWLVKGGFDKNEEYGRKMSIRQQSGHNQLAVGGHEDVSFTEWSRSAGP